jgi:hypothetical protein
MDPVWRSDPTIRPLTPRSQDFQNSVASEGNLTLEEVPGQRVSVAGFTVGTWDEQGVFSGYDAERKLWYCDIEMDYGDSYFPFVRLALARYQPKSIQWNGGDVKLSRVVLADFAQLAPDRTASVTFNSEIELRVTVTGLTADESGAQKFGMEGAFSPAPSSVPKLRSGRFETRPQAGILDPARDRGATAGLLDRLRPLSSPGGNTVEVSVEKLGAGSDEDLGWLAVPGTKAELPLAPSRSNLTVWSGLVQLPEPKSAGRYRLVIKEFEWYLADGMELVDGVMRRRVAPRLIYADTMEL